MTRRKRNQGRPRDHLVKAAERSAAIAAGVPHETEQAAAGETELEPSPRQEIARAQRRDEEGRFT